ncbi:MAG: amidase [Myxococcales bacterium]|nr:amidase [Myxococcales bacterium]MCB9533996.1 amidase [Myxococcales bacterium]
MSELLTLSGRELARRIARRELSSGEVVETHIRHVERVNPTLNAVVAERFDAARAEARAADERIRRDGADGLPAFFGVPCSIKECFALEGMPNTAGLVARAGRPAAADATAVARVRRAGAIPLGVTNTSELCMWMESNNRVYGRTNNPYDPTRIVGGSSGGEGAIVAAGGTPFGLGSDIGGSIRLPAFFNGVFGHKPSGGLVPGTGQFPMAENEALRYLATGPLARRAEDLHPFVAAVAGPDGADAGCAAMELGDPREVSLDGVPVVIVDENGWRGPSAELREALERAAAALERRGARVERRKFPALRRSFEIWATLLGDAEGEWTFRTHLEAGTKKNLGAELLRFAAGRSVHTLPALVLAGTERFSEAIGGSADAARAARDALRDELTAAMGSGVLLHPPYTRAAPRHNRPLLTPLDFVYTGIFNVLELPVTQVPVGLSSEGLPLGVQIVAPHGADHRSIRVAEVLEVELGGWVPPPCLQEVC